ncbi:MAG: LysM peptidoglycan-binding domain-containing protein [Micrococcaceae bacterium]
MATSITTDRPSEKSLGADDVALLLLTVISGPALLWLGTQWKSTQSALGQLELLIAAGCVVVGLSICLLTLTMSIGAALVFVGHILRSQRWTRWGWAISPWFLRRILVGALGVQLLTAGAAAASDTGAGTPSPAWSSHQTAAAEMSPATVQQSAVTSEDHWMPLAPDAVEPTKAQRTVEMEHIVVSGDSLWGIAAAELGSSATNYEIDQRWRQWWQENRTRVGDNPHLLIPGTVLKTPSWTH